MSGSTHITIVCPFQSIKLGSNEDFYECSDVAKENIFFIIFHYSKPWETWRR